ncbi:MAG: prepilin-type N-terminal cleavage/methylation domain-containing protein [Planctomycetota bacterium]
MNRARTAVAKGFTLVEILIVVVILGILAAIVIPQFTNASESAKFSSMLSQLQTIRSQVELYTNQHNDDYPTADGGSDSAWDWARLTSETELDGTAPEAGDIVYGPYLQKTPLNPFEDSSTVSGTPDTDGTAAAGVGWVWEGGLLKACMEADKATELGAAATDVATY